MSNAIYKYPLSTDNDTTELNLPIGASILDIQVQHGNPVLWALVDPDAMVSETRRIEGYLTGDCLRDGNAYKYLKTVLLEGGSYVAHYFEVLS